MLHVLLKLHLLAQLVQALLIHCLTIVIATHEKTSPLSPCMRQSLHRHVLHFFLLLMNEIFLDDPSMSLYQLLDLFLLLSEKIEVLSALADHVLKLKHCQELFIDLLQKIRYLHCWRELLSVYVQCLVHRFDLLLQVLWQRQILAKLIRHEIYT